MAYQYQDPVTHTTHYRPGGVWHNPGRDEAVAGMVLALFFPILGFILALLSLGRSRRYGWPGEKLAKVALWVSVLSIVAGIVSWFFLHRAAGYGIPVLSNLWWV